MRIDVHTYIGQYPFRHLPHPDPDALVRVLDREAVDAAWVGYLPAAWHRDPAPANVALHTALAAHSDRLRAVPTIRAGWPRWRDELVRARDDGAPAVRVYPQLIGLSPTSSEMFELATVCAELHLTMMLTVRFEDSRQRHALDVAGDLSATHVRELARAMAGATRIIVLGSGRAMIEEVHWGLTERERHALCWDLSWIWGPPEDDLATLLATIGAQHFVYGSGWPLRLAQTPRANLALLPDELRHVTLADPAAR